MYLNPFHLLVLLFLFGAVIVYLLPMWMIFKKAGFAPALSLLMAIPFVQIVMLYVLAFASWKVVPAKSAYDLTQL